MPSYPSDLVHPEQSKICLNINSLCRMQARKAAPLKTLKEGVTSKQQSGDILKENEYKWEPPLRLFFSRYNFDVLSVCVGYTY